MGNLRRRNCGNLFTLRALWCALILSPMTFDELAKTDLFCILFGRQYGFVFRRLGTFDDMTFTADPHFSDVVQQAGEYWGRFEAQIYTTAGDARGPSTGIFRVLILRPLEGSPEHILAGADFSVKIETAPGGVLDSKAAPYYFVSPCLPASLGSP